MIQTTLLLNNVNRVKEFVSIVNRYPYDVDLLSARYVVDGKSIMGIFSLNLKQPVILRIHADAEPEVDALLAELKIFQPE